MSDFDDRAFNALKELDEAGALAVIKQFKESNLQVHHNSILIFITLTYSKDIYSTLAAQKVHK